MHRLAPIAFLILVAAAVHARSAPPVAKSPAVRLRQAVQRVTDRFARPPRPWEAPYYTGVRYRTDRRHR